MALPYNGVASDESWENLRRREDAADEINVGKTERLVSGIAGVAVIALALRRKRLRRLLLPLGGSLLTRAVSGRCAVNRALGRNSARRDRVSPVSSVAQGEGIKVERTVVVDRPREEVYRFWRQLENLPRFMDHLESVTMLDENRSHWVAKAPAGTRVEWDATIHNEIEDELIAWRSLPGSDIDHAGSVHFTPANGGTEVRVVLSYDPPAGRVGAAVARLLGEEPGQQVEEDLRRFKQVVEALESPVRSRK
jgi:uncharacterized membrane protein